MSDTEDDLRQTRQRNVAVVRRLYELEMAKDLDSWARLWARGVVVMFPLAVDTEATRVEGLTTWVDVTRQKFVDRAHIKVDARVEALADPHRVLAHLDVHLEFSAGGSLNAPLLVLFTFDDDGLIERMDEYVNEAGIAAGPAPQT